MPYVWYCDSPLQAQLIINGLKNKNLLDDNLWKKLRTSLENNLITDLENNLLNNLDYNIRKKLREVLYYSTRNNLVDNLEYSLTNTLIDARLIDFYTYLYGSIESYWVSYFLFPYKYLGIDYGENNVKLEMMDKYIRNCGIIYTFKNICFVCENPVEINKKGIQLHADGKPSIKYKDGYGIYYLNGINVPDWLVLTPKEDLTIKQYNSIKNADVKAQFILKTGIEKFIDHGRIVDSYKNYNRETSFDNLDAFNNSEYELIDMSSILDGMDYAPYLKMKNQTTGIYHLETVAKSCKTLIEALDWRYGIDGFCKMFKIEDIK
jgi:hypothetical protein